MNPLPNETLLCFLNGAPKLSRFGIHERLSVEQWDSFLRKAARHGVAPLLYRSFQHFDLLPPWVREALDEAYVCNLLRNATIWQQLAEILRMFRDTGIPVIVLKGAHLAEIVYGDPALRPMADLDLLVQDEDLPRAEIRLREIGYNPMESVGPLDYDRHHHLRPFSKPGAVPVEIHRTIERRSGAVAIEIGHLWSRSREALVAGVEARVLSPEDLILHLCLHTAYNHRFEAPLLHLCDIAASVERYREDIEWQDLVAVCDRSGTGRFVHCALSLVVELLGAPVPPAAIESLQYSGDREIVEAARAYLLSSEPELPPVEQRGGEHDDSLRGRLRSLARILFPSRAELWWWSRVLLEVALQSRRLRPALDHEKNRRLIRRWVEDPAWGVVSTLR